MMSLLSIYSQKSHLKSIETFSMHMKLGAPKLFISPLLASWHFLQLAIAHAAIVMLSLVTMDSYF